MISACRICQRPFAKKAFDGEGARLFGGRWNSPGTSLVYLAGSVALAQLEMLVHLESDQVLHEKYLVFPVQFPSRIMQTLSPSDLPKNWRRSHPPAATRRIGDEWVKSARSLILKVPSVIVPQEFNCLLNPAHKDFRTLIISKPLPLRFDRRLA